MLNRPFFYVISAPIYIFYSSTAVITVNNVGLVSEPQITFAGGKSVFETDCFVT